MGPRSDVRHRVGPRVGRSRLRLPTVRDGGSLDVQRLDRLRLGLRLRVGLGSLPLRPLGVLARPWLVMDSGSPLRRRVGRVAHRTGGLRLRRLGAGSARMVLVRRLRRGLVVRLVPLPRLLRVLSARPFLPLARSRHVRRAWSRRARALRAHARLRSRIAWCWRWWRPSSREPHRRWSERWRGRPACRRKSLGQQKSWTSSRRDRQQGHGRRSAVEPSRSRQGAGVRHAEDGRGRRRRSTARHA